jgi:hypothetical protein
MPPRLAYRVGGVLPSLLGEADAIGDLLFNQTLSGIWTWTPDPDTQNLGLHGQPPLGVVAEEALPVLRFAATTGDTQVLTYGIRLLDYMDRFRIPTGGLGDDGVPLDAPDLQAATDAAECFALGYLLTQRSELLRRARFWADAGLPFIYFWRDGERPAMAFASVPTFGASRGRHPWYGIARQELGLAYGRVLRLLHDIQADPLYARVSDGLLISGMYQQYREGDFWEDPGDGGDGEKKDGMGDEGAGEEYDLAGLLPYSWNVFENEGRAPYLNPQRLLALMYAIEGYETRLSFGRALINSDRVFVASPNKIVRLDSTVTRVRATLHAPGDEAVFTSFSDFDQEPISIHVNGKPLDRTDGDEPLGWQWFPDRGFALVHARFTEGYNQIEVRMRQPVRSNREQRVQVPWINWPHRGGATRGWWR